MRKLIAVAPGKIKLGYRAMNKSGQNTKRIKHIFSWSITPSYESLCLFYHTVNVINVSKSNQMKMAEEQGFYL